MAKARGAWQVRDPAALDHLRRVQELQQQAERVDGEIARVLLPLKEPLSALVLERDRLLYEALSARQKFFAAARKANPELEEHRSLCYESRAGKVYVVWDDSGPHFSTEDSADLPQLHPFLRRRPGRRAWDLSFWLR